SAPCTTTSRGDRWYVVAPEEDSSEPTTSRRARCARSRRASVAASVVSVRRHLTVHVAYQPRGEATGSRSSPAALDRPLTVVTAPPTRGNPGALDPLPNPGMPSCRLRPPVIHHRLPSSSRNFW